MIRFLLGTFTVGLIGITIFAAVTTQTVKADKERDATFVCVMASEKHVHGEMISSESYWDLFSAPCEKAGNPEKGILL